MRLTRRMIALLRRRPRPAWHPSQGTPPPPRPAVLGDPPEMRATS